MNCKLEVLGFVGGLLVWFAVAVGTLLQLSQVAESSVALHEQTLPAPASKQAPAPMLTAQADLSAASSRR